MAAATYTASEQLVDYHVAGTDYAISFELSEAMPPSGGAIRVRTESLAGNTETLYFGARRVWKLTTAPVLRTSAQAALIREFLFSTADGQQFVLDPYADSSSSLPVNVTREDEGFTESVFSSVNGIDDLVQYGFQVREA